MTEIDQAVSLMRTKLLALNMGEDHGEQVADYAESIVEAPELAFLATLTFLRPMWNIVLGYLSAATNSIDPKLGLGPVNRLLAAGADPDDIRGVMAIASYGTIQDVLQRIDEGRDRQVSGYPAWKMVEVDEEGEPTGRPFLTGMMSFLQTLDPSGDESFGLYR